LTKTQSKKIAPNLVIKTPTFWWAQPGAHYAFNYAGYRECKIRQRRVCTYLELQGSGSTRRKRGNTPRRTRSIVGQRRPARERNKATAGVQQAPASFAKQTHRTINLTHIPIHFPSTPACLPSKHCGRPKTHARTQPVAGSGLVTPRQVSSTASFMSICTGGSEATGTV
jgi:hypothetical protein